MYLRIAFAAIITTGSVLLYSCKGRAFRQPTASMEETIMTEEVFYVNKTSSFKRNNIVVFNYFGEDYTSPTDEPRKFKMSWQKWAKRLIALSGDSLEIKDADVFINRRAVLPPPKSILEYDVFSIVAIDDLPQRNEWQATVSEIKGDTFHYVAALTTEQAANYKQRKPAIVSIRKKIVEHTNDDTILARPCGDCNWTIDNFGPLRIPSPGDTIIVTPVNFRLFHNIPGIQMGKNIIKEKLYFVMGDNRHLSQDSRYIGYISHSKMYGVVK